jgi:type I restriction enzyme S subunit
MRHIALSGLLVAMAKGIRERSTDFRFNDFADLALAAPPIEEQTAIVAFLDAKCANMDEAVRIKEEQIALLRERRQILIQQAVTRGLNPAAPMKDSGIDWIGQIPAHWEVKRFTKEIDVQEGPGIMAVDFHESGVPLIRISGVRGRNVTLEGCNYLSPAKVRRRWEHFKLSEGDLVISGRASTGFVSEVGPEAAGAVLYTGLMKLRVKHKNIKKRYLEHFLSSNLFATQVDLLKSGSTIAHYGPSHLGRMFLVLPPIEEQAQISSYCDEQYARLGEAISIKQDQIAALKEYKTSLINAAVTGKIRVT